MDELDPFAAAGTLVDDGYDPFAAAGTPIREQGRIASGLRATARGFGAVAAGVPVGVEVSKRRINLRAQQLFDMQEDALSQRALQAKRQIENIESRLESGALSEADANDLTNEALSGVEALEKYTKQQRGPSERPEDIATPMAESAGVQYGKDVRQFIEDTFGKPDPIDEGKLSQQVAEGAGSLLAFIPTTMLTGPAGGASVGYAAGAAGVYEDAVENGASEEEALEAAGLAGLAGTTEIVPILSFLKPVGRAGVAAFIQKVLQNAGEEGLQEGFQGTMQNLIAQGIYDPERGTFEDVPEQMLVGAILGGGVGAISGAVRNPATQAGPTPIEPTPAPENPAIDSDPTGPDAPQGMSEEFYVDEDTLLDAGMTVDEISGMTPEEIKTAAQQARSQGAKPSPDPEFQSETSPLDDIVSPADNAPQPEVVMSQEETDEAAILLSAGETAADIMEMNPSERREAALEALDQGVTPVTAEEAVSTMTRAIIDQTDIRPRLTDGDRASPISNDLIAGGKALLSGDVPARNEIPLPAIQNGLPANESDGKINSANPVELTGQPATAAPTTAATPKTKPRNRPVTLQKAPVVYALSGRGRAGIDPDGEAGRELIANGVTRKRFPTLFKKGGVDDIDNLTASEYPELAERVAVTPSDQSGGGYFDRADMIQAIIDEANGRPRRTAVETEIEARRNAAAAEYEFEPTPAPVNDDVGPVWNIPSPDIDISTPGERMDSVRASVEGYLQENNALDALDPREIAQIVRDLDDRGGSVIDTIDWWLVQESEYANSTDPEQFEPIPFPDAPINPGQADTFIAEPGPDAGTTQAGAEGVDGARPARTGTAENGAVDLTPDGAQTVIPGAEQISDRERAEREQQKAKRGGDAPMPEDSLFNPRGADLFDAPPATKPAILTPKSEREPEKELTADDVWMQEIAKAFPGERAGDVRYTDKANGEPGTALRAAYDNYVAEREAQDAARRPQQPANLVGATLTNAQGVEAKPTRAPTPAPRNLSPAKKQEKTSDKSTPTPAPNLDAEETPLVAAVRAAVARGTVTHTTKKGKVLKGVIADISLSEAKTIDKYPFRKTGGDPSVSGFFLRSERVKEWSDSLAAGEPTAPKPNAKVLRDIEKIVTPENMETPGFYSGKSGIVEFDYLSDTDAEITVTYYKTRYKGRVKETSSRQEKLKFSDAFESISDSTRKAVRAYLAAGDAEVTPDTSATPSAPSATPETNTRRPDTADSAVDMVSDLTNRAGESVVDGWLYRLAEGTKEQGWRVVLERQSGGRYVKDLTSDPGYPAWTREQAVEKAVNRAFPTPKADPAPKSNPAPSDFGAKNTLVSTSRAEEIKAKLKAKLNGTQLNAGIDPEMLSLGAELTAYYVEAGVRKFSDVIKRIAADLDTDPANLKKYARSWYNGARDMMEDSDVSIEGMDSSQDVLKAMKDVFPVKSAAPQPPAQNPATPIADNSPQSSAFDQIVDFFAAGKSFKNILEARKIVEEMSGQSDISRKDVEELIESAVVERARQIAQGDGSQAQKYEDLVRLYEAQPILGERTSTSVEQQAYSTPVPLAFLASERAGITEDKTVYEPSAGNGALLIGANPKNVTANELNQDRAERLGGFLGGEANVTQLDATEVSGVGPVDVVIENPPFGAVFGDERSRQTWNVDGLSTKEVDHAIVMQSLQEMKPDGSAVLIIGGQKGKTTKERTLGYRGEGRRQFFNKLYGDYNVVDHFTVSGDLYKKQGAQWPVDVIVIKGKGKSALPLPMANAPRMFKSWATLQDALNDRLDATQQLSNAGNSEPIRAPQNTDTSAVPSSAIQQDRPAGGGGNSGTRGGNAVSGGGKRTPSGGGESSVSGPSTRGEQSISSGQSGTANATNSGRSPETQPGDSGRTEGGNAGRLSGDALPLEKIERVNEEAESDFQVQYTPTSNAEFAVGTLVPRNMQTAMASALKNLQDKVGDIDNFVADRLGYTRTELLGNKSRPGYFSAEQVDAIALAIENVESGSGFIIGDQTGVGKGRVVAAMLRYAMERGRVPVFVTKDPGLYADMVRDLRDIGMGGSKAPRVLVSNNGLRGDKSIPLNPEDPTDVLRSLPNAKQKAAIQEMAATGNMPDGFDMFFTTYSQLQYAPGSKDTDRQRAVMAISPNSMFVLDESHEAGGSGPAERAPKNKDGTEKKTRADFIREVLVPANGVVYSSATYAKNPNVMSLYFKTDLSLAVDNISELADAISAGGVPLQQVSANMLVEAGQYARRERSYEGVSIDLEQMETDSEAARETSDALRNVFQTDSLYMESAREAFIEEIEAEGGKGGMDNAVGENSASSVGFGQIMHNVVSQALLSLKARSVVKRAVELAKAGEKPIIALSNTNEAIIKDYIESEGLSEGQEASPDFNRILLRYLDRTRRITIKDASDNKQHLFIEVDELDNYGPEGTRAEYLRVQKLIEDADLSGLPASPIDFILDELRAAGINAGEITGRQTTLRDGKVAARKSGPGDKKKVMNDFNSGKVDALVINRSGSTGFSLHATDKKGNDGKPRHMIVLQPDANIDVFMQMLGRIHRTGQTKLPNYTIAVSDLAVEKRPAAVLMRKMASLNANTTASKKSAVSLDVVDILNKYGDEVVADFLRENPEIANITNVRPGKDIAGIASKFTGRIAILPDETVVDIYASLEETYAGYVETLDSMGMNTLEAKTLDLKAATISTTQLTEGQGGESPFAQGSQVETIQARVLGEPHKIEKVRELIAEAESKNAPADSTAILREKTPAYLAKIEGSLAAANKRADEAKTEKQKDTANSAISNWQAKKAEAQTAVEDIIRDIDRLAPGKTFTIAAVQGENVTRMQAISLGVDVSKVKANPTAKSVISARFAVADPSKEVRIPLSKMTGEAPPYSISSVSEETAYAAFEGFDGERTEERQIVTGNLISGFAKIGKGQITLFTAENGDVREGILLPREFDVSASLESLPVDFKDGFQVASFLAGGTDRLVGTGDGVARISMSRGEVRVTIARKGGKAYYLLKKVRDIIGDFESRSGAFINTISPALVPDVVNAYMENLGAKFQTESFKDEAREITGQVIPEAKPVEKPIQKERRVSAPKEQAKLTTGKVRELRDRLSKLVPDGVALRVEELITSNMQGNIGRKTKAKGAVRALRDDKTGEHSDFEVIIANALDAKATLDHEAIHVLKMMGLFTKKEWAALTARAKRRWIKRHNIKNRYPDGNEALWVEEAIAEEFASWRKKVDATEPKTARDAFKKIGDFMQAVGNWLRGMGFNSSESIFRDVSEGAVGGRERGASESVTRYRHPNTPAGPFETYESRSAREVLRLFAPGNWSELSDIENWEDTYSVLRRNMADKMTPLLRQQNAVKASGHDIPVSADAYMAESLYHGRTGERLRQFYEGDVQELTSMIKDAGLSQRDVDDYLIARHVAERNRQMAKLREETDPDHDFVKALYDPTIVGGSGHSLNWAKEVKRKVVQEGKSSVYMAISAKVDAINNAKLDSDVAAGLTSQEAADAMRATYDHYVPLRGHELDADSGASGLGRGFDIRGEEGQRASGRRTRADSPLAYALSARANGIIRAEKNRVGRTFLRFVEANPNEAAWSVNRSQTKTRIKNKLVQKIDPATGLPVTVRQDVAQDEQAPPSRIDDNVMIVKKGGSEIYITIENRDLAAAMKNMDVDNQNSVIRLLGSIVRVMSMLNTTLNIEWFVTNMSRDLQSAAIQISDADIKGLRGKMLKNWPSAMRGAFDFFRGKEDGEWAKIAKDFTEHGGKVDYIEMRDIEGFKDLIKGQVSPSALSKIVDAGPKKVLKGVEILTGAGENGIRIAAYKAAVDMGVPKDKAASIARELTVNFNRKGTMGPTMNALYMFFNAAVQGNMRLVQSAVKSKQTQKILFGLTTLGALETVLGLGDEDEYEKVEDYVRERNFVIMLEPLGLGESGEYVKLPMPYGFNVFKTIGTEIGRTMLYGAEPSTAASNIASAAINSFNPIGGQDLMAVLTPTVLDPALDIALNRNFFESSIRPDYPNDKRPDSEKYFPNVSESSRAISAWANEATGGNIHREGWLSFSPENLDHLITSYAGGFGRLANNLIRTGGDAAAERPFEPERAPFLRQIYGQTYGQMPTWRAYDSIADRALDLENEISGFKKAKDSAAVRRAMQRDPDLTKILPQVKATQKRIRDIRKKEREVKASRIPDAAKDERVLALQEQSYQLQRRLLAKWAEITK